MALPEQQPFDISSMPELSRLADEVQKTQRPRVLRRFNKDTAMLVPLANAAPTPMPHNPALDAVLARLPKDSVIARTAGILHTDQPFPGYEEEKAAFEQAVADEVMESLTR